MAVAGPLARNIEDLELALGIISQTTMEYRNLIPLQSDRDTLNIKDLKIAWIDEFGGEPVDNEIKNAIEKFVTSIEDAGASITKISPDLDFLQVWKTWGSFVGMQG